MSDLDRIRWQCRRGMLELDLVLNRFVEQELPGLTPDELETFRRLLGEPDPWLLAWLMEQETAPAPYAALVQRLRSIEGIPKL